MATKHAAPPRRSPKIGRGPKIGSPIEPEARFPFTYRCPQPLVKRLDDARWQLRAKSRTALVTEAIEAFLDSKKIPRATDAQLSRAAGH